MSEFLIRDMRVSYGTGAGRLNAVRGVNLTVNAGETVGLVGESGCGKSSLARAAIGLVPLDSGQILLDGTDVTNALRHKKKHALGRVQMIFQDPYSSLNPRLTVRETLSEAVTAHHALGRDELERELSRLVDVVKLPKSCLQRKPHEFSGGQRQRVAIARALGVRPSVLIADEITSALDVSVQASILNLLREIQFETNIACLFISHNLAVVRYISDRVMVMHLGRIVEHAPSGELFESPRHPYTKVLLDSVPSLTVRRGALARARREPVDPHLPPTGCHFRTRCPVGPEVLDRRHDCTSANPDLVQVSGRHDVACHHPLEQEPSMQGRM